MEQQKVLNMRLVTASQRGVGIAVLPLDPHETYFADAVAAYCSSDVSGITSKVDATISDVGNNIPVSYSQTTTSITVTFTVPHKLGSAVDYCVISGTGIVGVDGTWQVASITSPTVLVLTSTTSQTKSGLAVATPLRFYQNIIATNTAATITLPTYSAVLPLYLIPYSALILNVTAWTAGTAYVEARQAGSGK